MALHGDAIRQANSECKGLSFESVFSFFFFCGDLELMGLPLFLIFFEARQIKNEIQKKGKVVEIFFGSRATRSTEVPKEFEAYTSYTV